MTTSLQVHKKEKSIWIYIIDILIISTVSVGVVYVFWFNEYISLKILIGILLAIFSLGFLSKQFSLQDSPSVVDTEISKLVLLSEEGESLKEWYIHGETSLLIGKSSKQSEVDIDLSDSEYAALISKEHAVLNYVQGNWYLEDIESRNGVGIKKGNKGTKFMLEEQNPYQIAAGDIVYIANTRLLLK